MTKRSGLISAALLSVIPTASYAVHINTDGAGQIALLPYYTINNNFITNLTVTNTTDHYKAIKVRFHESRIGADVLDLNIYLSPYDVWNATLRRNQASGFPNLITEDESCSYPDKALFQSGIDLRDNYNITSTEDLSEGYVEIIEMGVIADGPGPADDGGLYAEIDSSGSADGIINESAGDRSITTGLQHDASGMPADCSVIADAWAAGARNGQINGFESGSLSVNGVAQDAGGSGAPYADSMNAGLVEPNGGIKAYSIMVRVSSGAAFVQQATHIENYTHVAQHYRPDDAVNSQLPSLASGDVQRVNMLSSDGNSTKSIDVPLFEYDTGALFDIAPNPSVPMGSNPLPIALALSADAVSSPYFIESGSFAETDIVLTFPMRKHGIYNSSTLSNDLDGSGPQEACAGTLNDNIDDGESVILGSLGTQVHDYPSTTNGALCGSAGYVPNATPDVGVNLYAYDYEENAKELLINPPDDGWPEPPVYIPEENTLSLQRAVNVISLNRLEGGNVSVLGTPAANVFDWQLDAGFDAGWATIAFNKMLVDISYDYEANTSINALTEISGGIGSDYGIWTGVPVIGFSAMASDLGPHQLGEVVELYRSVNRNQ
jgi:hypothetical protein